MSDPVPPTPGGAGADQPAASRSPAGGAGVPPAQLPQNPAVPPEDRADALRKLLDLFDNRLPELFTLLTATRARLGRLTDDEALRVAARFNVTPKAVRKRERWVLASEVRGEHRVVVCLNTQCSAKGSEKLMRLLELAASTLNRGDTAGKTMSVHPVICLKNCAQAPCILFSGEVHTKVSEDRIMRDIRRCAKAGLTIEEKEYGAKGYFDEGWN